MNAVSGRLRWQCRRGLLEVDLLLNGFLDHPQGYTALSPANQALFQELLNYSDNELLAWVLGSEAPLNRTLDDVLESIRRAAAA